MMISVCVGVMYSGEYDVCDVTRRVHPHLRIFGQFCAPALQVRPDCAPMQDLVGNCPTLQSGKQLLTEAGVCTAFTKKITCETKEIS
jgi:hypothetical protein